MDNGSEVNARPERTRSWPGAAGARTDSRRHRLSGFGKRVIALLLDNVLILGTLGAFPTIFLSPDEQYWFGFALGAFFFLTIPVLAFTWAMTFALSEWLFSGRTVGKAVVGIAVRDVDDHGRVAFRRLLDREISRAVLAVLLFVPFLIDGLAALRNADQQTWHDRTARTVVVDTRDSRVGAVVAIVVIVGLVAVAIKKL
jgi:uncharacterized RDD family membrane protein YckC